MIEMMRRSSSILNLKANRTLGASLVEEGLVSLTDLESANDAFLDAVRNGGDEHYVSLLEILLYQQQTLNEADLIDHQITELGLGAMLLNIYAVNEEYQRQFRVEDCYATWTYPLDQHEGIHFLATSYYLSPFVKKHWEETLDGEVVWYVTDFLSLKNALEAFKGSHTVVEDFAPQVAAG